MNRDGLLLAAAPEPRSELVCNRKECMLLFFSVDDRINHSLQMHMPKKEASQSWFIDSWKRFKLPSRPTRRWNLTQEYMTNRKNKLCHCGKPKTEWDSKFRRLYCSNFCSEDWNTRTIFWSEYRIRVLSEHSVKTEQTDNYHRHMRKQTCDNCGKITNDAYENWDVDHIIAIMNGGHPWDKRNLQVLCEECHKFKTKQDHEEKREVFLSESTLVINEVETIQKKVSELPKGQLTF